MIPVAARQLVEEGIGYLYWDGHELDHRDSKADVLISSVSTNSREVDNGGAFVAILGERVDGHNFVAGLDPDIVNLAVVNQPVEDAHVLQLVVHDTVRALGDMARLNISLRRELAHRGVNEFTVVAVTGSVGKTTTKDMLTSVLSAVAPTVAPIGSFNNEIGLPLTALKVDARTRFMVAEMGASAVGEIKYLTSIVPPDISIVLKVGVAHLGGFGSVDHVRDAKAEIVEALTSSGVAVLNADDDFVRTMSPMTRAGNIIWFTRHTDVTTSDLPSRAGLSQVIVSGVDSSLDSANRPRFSVKLPDGSSYVMRLGIPGEHNVYNALAVISVVYSLDIPDHIAASVLSQLSTISPHRMHIAPVVSHGVEFTVIDDSFNANPDSMKAGLNALATFEGEKKQDSDMVRIAVVGAMLELGDGEEDAHRQIGQYAAGKADYIIAVGSQSDEYLTRLAGFLADGAGDKARLVTSADDADEAVRHIITDIRSRHNGEKTVRAIVLLKGSHASGLSGLATQWLS